MGPIVYARRSPYRGSASGPVIRVDPYVVRGWKGRLTRAEPGQLVRVWCSSKKLVLLPDVLSIFPKNVLSNYWGSQSFPTLDRPSFQDGLKHGLHVLSGLVDDFI